MHVLCRAPEGSSVAGLARQPLVTWRWAEGCVLCQWLPVGHMWLCVCIRYPSSGKCPTEGQASFVQAVLVVATPAQSCRIATPGVHPEQRQQQPAAPVGVLASTVSHSDLNIWSNCARATCAQSMCCGLKEIWALPTSLLLQLRFHPSAMQLS